MLGRRRVDQQGDITAVSRYCRKKGRMRPDGLTFGGYQ